MKALGNERLSVGRISATTYPASVTFLKRLDLATKASTNICHLILVATVDWGQWVAFEPKGARHRRCSDSSVFRHS
jgi:hypothetical protein